MGRGPAGPDRWSAPWGRAARVTDDYLPGFRGSAGSAAGRRVWPERAALSRGVAGWAVVALPWLLAFVFLGDTVTIGTEGLWTSAMLLLGTVVILGIFLITNRRLSRWEGVILVVLYVAFVIWAWFGG